jgi:hypothetical protein
MNKNLNKLIKLYDTIKKNVLNYVYLPHNMYMLSMALYDIAYTVQQHNIILNELIDQKSTSSAAGAVLNDQLSNLFKKDNDNKKAN